MIPGSAHEPILDKRERLETWTSHDRVVCLAKDFIKNCPADLLAKNFAPNDAYNKSVSFPKDYVVLDKAGTAIADGWALIAI